MNSHKYDKDYYEDGIRRGVSGYENYKWLPSRSISEALDIKHNFRFKSCVDYGCAKGFMVRALRLLGSDAHGEDISEYALSTAPEEVKPYLSLPNNKCYDLLLCRDVLEHIPEDDLPKLIKQLSKKAEQFFFIIPLGDFNRFRIREYEIDITHVTKKDEEWWITLFKDNGLELIDFSYKFNYIKEKWIKVHPFGNGFFTLRNTTQSTLSVKPI
jgi:predicted TPR repeat methyltransferase